MSFLSSSSFQLNMCANLIEVKNKQIKAKSILRHLEWLSSIKRYRNHFSNTCTETKIPENLEKIMQTTTNPANASNCQVPFRRRSAFQSLEKRRFEFFPNTDLCKNYANFCVLKTYFYFETFSNTFFRNS